jgi:futalosine hydrolase
MNALLHNKHRCLITAATEAEIAPIMAKFPQAAYFISGVGTPDTLFRLHQKLSGGDYALVLQAGICGSFTNALPLGATVMVKKDCFGDLGFWEKNKFTPLAKSAFAKSNSKPYTDGWLVNPYLQENVPLPRVAAITVNQVTDNTRQIGALKKHFAADIETMEGAACHYVCLMLGLPFLQIRSISNRVGERDKRKWNIKKAIHNLNTVLELINLPKDELDPDAFQNL